MPTIDTPLLIVGHGPGALVTAKLVSGAGLPCLVAGHQPLDRQQPVELDDRSRSILEPDGVLGVLRPYAASQEPFAIAPVLLENGLKHHCVADMLITVYDGMTLGSSCRSGRGISGVLTDGRSEWDLRADTYLDVTDFPANLNQAIHRSSEWAESFLGELSEGTGLS